ncbi:MAG: hypothetical protein GY756_08700 [bacterium]|nr:hypothetical protein [bacterium]
MKKKYRYWRMRTVIGLYGRYVIFYVTRKAYTYTAPVLGNQLPVILVK